METNGTAAGPLAERLFRRGWVAIDFATDDGDTLPIVLRRISPRLYLEIAGSAFAELVADGGDEMRQPKPAELSRQYEALERLVCKGVVTEVGSHAPALDADTVGMFSTDEVSRLATEILRFSGLTDEAKGAARRFRKKS